MLFKIKEIAAFVMSGDRNYLSVKMIPHADFILRNPRA